MCFDSFQKQIIGSEKLQNIEIYCFIFFISKFGSENNSRIHLFSEIHLKIVTKNFGKFCFGRFFLNIKKKTCNGLRVIFPERIRYIYRQIKKMKISDVVRDRGRQIF